MSKSWSERRTSEESCRPDASHPGFFHNIVSEHRVPSFFTMTIVCRYGVFMQAVTTSQRLLKNMRMLNPSSLDSIVLPSRLISSFFITLFKCSTFFAVLSLPPFGPFATAGIIFLPRWARNIRTRLDGKIRSTAERKILPYIRGGLTALSRLKRPTIFAAK